MGFENPEEDGQGLNNGPGAQSGSARVAVTLLAYYLPSAQARLGAEAGDWRPERAASFLALSHALAVLREEHRRLADNVGVEL